MRAHAGLSRRDCREHGGFMLPVPECPPTPDMMHNSNSLNVKQQASEREEIERGYGKRPAPLAGTNGEYEEFSMLNPRNLYNPDPPKVTPAYVEYSWAKGHPYSGAVQRCTIDPHFHMYDECDWCASEAPLTIREFNGTPLELDHYCRHGLCACKHSDVDCWEEGCHCDRIVYTDDDEVRVSTMHLCSYCLSHFNYLEHAMDHETDWKEDVDALVGGPSFFTPIKWFADAAPFIPCRYPGCTCVHGAATCTMVACHHHETVQRTFLVPHRNLHAPPEKARELDYFARQKILSVWDTEPWFKLRDIELPSVDDLPKLKTMSFAEEVKPFVQNFDDLRELVANATFENGGLVYCNPEGLRVVSGAMQAAISGVAPTVAQTEDVIRNDAEAVPVSGNTMPSRRAAAVSWPIETLDIETIFGREYIIDNAVAWLTTQERGFTVREWSFPSVFLDNTRAPFGLSQYHAFFRGDFEVTLRLNHYPFASGSLLLVCVPPDFVFTETPYSNQSEGTNINSWLIFPHTFVKAGDEHIATLRVPWMSEYRMIAPRSEDMRSTESAKVLCIVWSGLNIGAGMPSVVSGAMWARAIEPKMAVKAVKQASKHQNMLGKLTDTLLGDMPLLSAVAKTVGGVAGFFDAPTVNPPNAGAATAADVPRPSLCQTVLSDSNVPYDGEHFSGMDHKLDLIDRCKIPCMFAQFGWASSTASDALLFDHLVHPILMTQRASFSTSESDRDSTELSYWTSLYEFWRGSIDVTFEVVATRFHQGQLLVCWSPFPITNKDLNICSTLACASITLGSNNNRTTVRIPYISRTDYKHSRPSLGQINHLGHLLVFVQNPLVSPTTVASSVNVLVYVSGGEDYELKHPVNVSREQLRVRMNGQWQASLTDTAKDTFQPVSIVQATDVETGFYGKSQTDARMIMRHPEVITDTTINYNGRNAILCHGVFMPQNDSNRTHKIVSLGWRYWTGAMRCHVHTSISPLYPVLFQAYAESRNAYSTTLVNEWVVNPPYVGTVTSRGTARFAQHTSADGSSFIIDFPYLCTVPFRHTYASVEVLSPHSPGYWQLLAQPVEITGAQPMRPVVRFEHSVGDDFQFAVPTPVHALRYGLGWLPATKIGTTYRPPTPGNYDLGSPDEDVVDSGDCSLSDDGWVRDLTEEGIESNPGPVFSKPVVQPQVCNRFIKDFQKGCDEFWQQVDVYGFVFLVSFFIWYLILDCTGMTHTLKVWVRDLTREGVEPNPGPSVLSKFLVEDYPRRLNDCFNPMVLQAVQQANFDLASVLSSLFEVMRSIYDAIRATPRVLRGITQVGAALYGVDHFLETLPHAFMVLLDDILPAMTAIHTLFTGGTTAQILALASLLRLTYKNMPEPKEPQEVPAYDTPVDDDAFSNLMRTSADYDEFGFNPRAATQQGLLDDAKSFGTGFVHGVRNTSLEALLAPDKGCVGKNTYTYLLREWVSDFISAFLRPFGYILGPGWHSYIRRSCGATEGFTGVLLRLWHTLLYLFHGDTLNKEWERSQMNAIVGTINKFDRLMQTDAFDTPNLDARCATFDGTNLEFLKYASEQCVKYRKLAAEFVTPANIASSCQRIIDYYAKKRRSSLYRTTQPEPVGLFFGGDPGIGKTLLLSTYLPAILLPKAGFGTGNVDREVYNVPLGEQKFWDGYDSQPFIVLDEMLQEREGGDPLLIIRAINAIRMPINKADLCDKGAVFRSKFFAVSSNSISLEAAYQSISCPAAIARRLPFSYKLVLKDAFRVNGRLAVDALNKALEKADDPVVVLDQVWEFYPLDLMTGRVTVPCVKFSEVIQAVVDCSKSRHVGHTAILDACGVISSAVRRASTQMMASSTNPFDDVWEDASEDAETLRCKLRSKGQVFKNIIEKYGDVDGNEADECDKVINILSVCNDHELGFDSKELKKLLVPGSVDPFTTVAGRETYETSAADRIWKNSNLFKRSEGPGKIFPGILRILVVAGAAFATVFTVFSIIAKFVRQGVTVVKACAQAYDSVKTTKSLKSVPKSINTVKGAIPQAGENCVSEIADRIRKNVRELYMRSNGGKGGSVQCLCLDSRTLLIPDHFYKTHRKNIEMGFQSYCFISVASSNFELQNSMPVMIGPSNSMLVKNSNCDDSYSYPMTDTRLVSLTTEVVSHARDIWHFLYPKESPKVFEGRREAILLGHKCAMKHTEDIDVRVREFSLVECYPGAKMILASSTICTEVGDCGRPYILVGHPKPLIGMHALLTDDEKLLGLTPTYYEDIKKAYDDLKPNVVAIEPVTAKLQFGPATPRHEKYWNSGMELLGIGKFGDKQLTHYVPTETKYVRVAYRGILVQHEEWECDVLPSANRPIDGKHPLFTNMQKYAVNEPLSSVPRGFYEHCLAHYVQKLPKSASRRVLTWHEAINGFENLQPLAMNTSSGYWTSLGFKDGKHQFFTPLPQEYSDSGELLPVEYTFSEKALTTVVPLFGCTFFERVQEMYDECLQGKAPFTIWCSTVKDELLKRPKVEACKSRVFEQCGLDMTLLFRREFGAFLSWFRSNYGFTLHSGIGADKEAVWGEYARILRQNSPVGFRYDYANYDGSVMHAGFQFFGDICDAFYQDTGEHRKARWAMLEVLRFSLMLADDCFYTSNSGNKSGNPFTDVFNTVTNTLCVYLAYLLIMRNHRNQPTLADFEEEVKFLTYGDDVVGTMRPDIMKKCSGPAVQAVLAMLGYKVTDAAKNTVIEDSCPFEELCFLKSGWRYDSGVWCAPMEKPAIFKELRYRPKAFQYDEADLQLRFSIVQRFIAHWGAEELRKFQVQARSIGIPPSWVTYSYGEFIADMRMKQEGVVLY